jgi:hypothetical protein
MALAIIVRSPKILLPTLCETVCVCLCFCCGGGGGGRRDCAHERDNHYAAARHRVHFLSVYVGCMHAFA